MRTNLNSTSSAHLPARWWRALALVAVALVLTACGAADDPDSAAGGAGGTTPATSPGGADAFPVTFEQMKGPVTVPAAPTRVVTLGYTDTDIANALGAEIVAAVRSPFGSDGVNPPWATTPLSAAVAGLDPQAPSLEAIAAAEPDIILAMGAYPGAIDLYDELSAIAPTITPTTGPLLDSAEHVTTTIGRALGRSEAAARLLDDAERAIADFAAATPALAGKTAVFAPREGTSTAVFIDESAASVTLLRRLGLTTPTALASLPGERTFGATFVSDELLDVLDEADLVIAGLYTEVARTEFLALPTIAGSKVVTEGRLIPIDRTLGAALQTPNPVSLHHLLAELGPRLAAAAAAG